MTTSNEAKYSQHLRPTGHAGSASRREAASQTIPPSHGRGGSVSRRDHNQVYRRPTVLTGGTNSAEPPPPNASCSSGGGPGEGLLSEKPPSPAYSFPRTVAAALSAAVTTTKFTGDRPYSQAEPTSQSHLRQTPAALREGVRGRGFSQRSRLPRRHSSSVFPNNAFVKDLASKGWRSSMPSPTPMYQTGTFNS